MANAESVPPLREDLQRPRVDFRGVVDHLRLRDRHGGVIFCVNHQRRHRSPRHRRRDVVGARVGDVYRQRWGPGVCQVDAPAGQSRLHATGERVVGQGGAGGQDRSQIGFVDGGVPERPHGGIAHVGVVVEQGERAQRALPTPEDLTCRDAVEAVRLLCPLLNASPEPHDLLRKAIAYIEAKGGTLDSVFSAAARRRGRRSTARLSKLDPHIRMALEILASADSENRALSGDLKTLEMAWERADELAEIEDDLAFELGVVERLKAGEPS